MATAPIYRDCLIPWGPGWCAAVGLLPRPRDAVWICVQRAIAKAAFAEDEFATLGRLGRHAETALRIGMRLGEADAAKAALSRLLGEFDCGVLLLGAEGHVAFANPLDARVLATERTFGRQIARHCAAAAKAGTAAPTPVVVRRAAGPTVVRAPSRSPSGASATCLPAPRSARPHPGRGSRGLASR